MTLDEFYALVGGSVDEVMSRLQLERLVRKYLGLFEQDDSYQQLTAAIASRNWEDVFRASHTLKGVAANLGLGDLYRASSDLCENCRGKEPDDSVDEQFEAVKVAYDKAKAAIDQLKAEEA